MVGSREDVIWLAGLFEGEGCITVTDQKTSERARRRWEVNITGCDRDVIERVQSIVGFGFIRKRKRTEPGWRDYYIWQTTRREHVYVFLAAIYPFLMSRRKARAREAMAELPPVRGRLPWTDAQKERASLRARGLL